MAANMFNGRHLHRLSNEEGRMKNEEFASNILNLAFLGGISHFLGLTGFDLV